MLTKSCQINILNLINRQRMLVICNVQQKNNYSKYVSEKEIKKCYNILDISEDSDQEQIRAAYLKLVKRFHPDSGNPEANSDKFQEIDKAFRILLRKKSKERWSADELNVNLEAKEFDIKHTAPQHRQYLSYDGIGIGTPFQRQKQYGKVRALHAAENVLTHRVNKAQADEKVLLDKRPQKHKIKTKYGYERLVEDLIQEAMSRGEFDNLSGKGKPLPTHQNTNPYVDFVTHKLNQVLIENGFTPEWIMLQKEIREEKNILLNSLNTERMNLGTYPFDDLDDYKWGKAIENCKKLVNNLNKKIEKYNLLVPVLQKQMLLVSLNKEAEKVAKYGQTNHDVIQEKQKKTEVSEARDNPQNIFSFFESFFYKN